MSFVFEIAVIGLLMNLFFFIFTAVVAVIETITGDKVDSMKYAVRAQTLNVEIRVLRNKYLNMFSRLFILIPFFPAYVYFKVMLRAFTKPEMVIMSVVYFLEEELRNLERSKKS